MKIPTLLAAISYPAMYFYMCYYIYISPKWSFIITVLLYELMVLSFTALIIVAIYFSVLAMVYFFFIPLLKVLRYFFSSVSSLYYALRDFTRGVRFMMTGFVPGNKRNTNSQRIKND